ncbi:MAG: hypothetical protein KDE19_10795 [Caldilineaceae bacterium]|nr:hypothetical protein [Caldilineaceae bacterium]
MNPTDVSLHDLITEIHEFDRKLQALEEKYNLRSEDFFELYETGQLRDEDLDEIDEFGRWAAWYRMRARRIAQYDTLKTAFLTEQTQPNGIVLKPHQALQEAA